MSGRPLVIAAGGTGGHLFPAEALADVLMKRGRHVVMMVDARAVALSPEAPCERIVLEGSGLAGRSVRQMTRGVWALLRGAWRARIAMRGLRPGAVVAFGGYPAVPPVLAAWTLWPRPAVILHEQNAVLGRANRLLCRVADRLVLGFAGAERVPASVRGVAIGNPVRAALRGRLRSYKPPRQGSIELLVLGGSLGAGVFAELLPDALAGLPSELRERLHLVQQVRAADHDEVARRYEALGLRAELAPFFPDMADRLATAHLVLARAGASTVAELLATARPGLLLPLPNAIDDHQRRNAAMLAACGGGWVLEQEGLTASALGERLAALLGDPDALAAASAACAAGGRADAAETLADLVEEMARP